MSVNECANVLIFHVYAFMFMCLPSCDSSHMPPPLPSAMEGQVEELSQQLEKQTLINQELQNHNNDLGTTTITTLTMIMITTKTTDIK